ncbi:MAG: hypothetical protein ACOC1K_01645 [Nanoarchaeota archaeon]
MKKIITFLTTILLFAMKPVMAAVPSPSFNVGGIFDFLGTILGYISSLFGMGWLAGNEEGFFKFLLWILVFIIFFMVGQIVFAKYGDDAKSAKKYATIISIILATTTTLLTPIDLVISLFSMYATVIILLFMVVIIFAIVKLIYGKWLSDLIGTGFLLHLARLFGLYLCWLILSIVSGTADQSFNVQTFQNTLGQITTSLSSLIQIALIVAMIIEVFKLFGSLKGKGDAASNTADWAVNAGKKLFGQTEEQKQKRQERAAQKEKELEEETKRLEELGKYLGTLSLSERDSLARVEQGVGILKQVQEDKSKLTNPQVLSQLKNNLAEQLGNAAKSLFDNNYKRMKTNNTFRKQDRIKQDIDDLEKEFDNIGKSIEDELIKSTNNIKQLEKTFGENSQELQSFKNHHQRLEAQNESFKQTRQTFDNLCAKLKDDEQKYAESIRIMVGVTRRSRTEISKLRISTDKLFKVLKEIEDSLKDPMKRGKALSSFDSVVGEFDNMLPHLKSSIEDMLALSGNLHNIMAPIYNDLKRVKDEINKMNNSLTQLSNNIPSKGK